MKCALHVTDLDSWVWFKKIESMPTEEMVGRLLRTEPPNDNMRRGTAWHDILENPPDTIEAVERDGFKFIVDCDAEITLPQIREIREKKAYCASGVEVTLSGKCDGITANIVKDHKFTFKPNPENYLESFQWKAYLDIFDADVFEYIIYHGYARGNMVTIKNVSTMRLYRYPGMVDDILSGVSELIEFIKVYVPGKITA